jgi:O-antigen ligase
MLASRASLIMCCIAIIYLFINKTIERKYIVAFVVIFIVFQAVTPHTYSRFLSILENKGLKKEEIAFGRIVIWKAAMNVFKENPVIGAGPGNFFELSQVKINEIIYLENPGIDIFILKSNDQYVVGKGNPHNLFLAVLCETGIAGFTIFILLIGGIAYFLVKTRRWLSLLFLFLVLQVSFLSNFAPYYKFYMLICIICYTASKCDLRCDMRFNKNIAPVDNSLHKSPF